MRVRVCGRVIARRRVNITRWQARSRGIHKIAARAAGDAGSHYVNDARAVGQVNCIIEICVAVHRITTACAAVLREAYPVP